MGRDKALLVFRGKTLLEHALATARALDPGARIVGGAYGGLAPVVEDEFVGQGPLAGIQAALRASTTELNVVLAVDTPLLTAALLRYLARRAADSDALAVVPQIADGIHPLCAVYRRAFADFAEAQLRAGRNKIELVVRAHQHVFVTEAELAQHGFGPELFHNLNTAEEFEAALGDVT